ncbi:hypothetical protein [Rhodococcus sp. NPDC003348]
MTALDLGDRTEPCRSCRAEIVWTTTRDGNLMPVNARPSNAGNVAIQKAGTVLHAGVVPPRQARAMRAAGVDLYLSHHVDCPDADQWRTTPRKGTR